MMHTLEICLDLRANSFNPVCHELVEGSDCILIIRQPLWIRHAHHERLFLIPASRAQVYFIRITLWY